MTTVVTKLLNMVPPDVAFFGQKDAQQALVIRRLVRDLDLPVRIEVVPTVREPTAWRCRAATCACDGDDRRRALRARAALGAAAQAGAAGDRDAERRSRAAARAP